MKALKHYLDPVLGIAVEIIYTLAIMSAGLLISVAVIYF